MIACSFAYLRVRSSFDPSLDHLFGCGNVVEEDSTTSRGRTTRGKGKGCQSQCLHEIKMLNNNNRYCRLGPRITRLDVLLVTVLKTKEISSNGQPDHQIKQALLQVFYVYTLSSNTSHQEKKVNYYLWVFVCLFTKARTLMKISMLQSSSINNSE